MPEDRQAELVVSRGQYGTETLPLLQDRTDQVALEEEFLPGFKLVGAPGHRTDHVAVEISSNGETLLHVADSIRHAIQAAYPHFYSGIDSYPEQIAETNRALLDRAAQNNTLIFGAHMGFPALGRVRVEGDAWRMEML